MLSFNEILQKIENEISQLSFEYPPKSLYDPIEYILSLGGKRIRPALALMACNLYKENVDNVINPALGIEVFHNFTLLHDDLMDTADKSMERQHSDSFGRRYVDCRLSTDRKNKTGTPERSVRPVHCHSSRDLWRSAI